MNREVLLHPADGDEIPSFDGFLPFVQVGTDSPYNQFVEFLEQLHTMTGDAWRPGACGAATFLAKSARDIDQPKADVYPKNHTLSHYWINVILSGQELVIDPYGIPDYLDDWEAEPRFITPFFGRADLAQTERHRKIYSEAVDGHRRFIM